MNRAAAPSLAHSAYGATGARRLEAGVAAEDLFLAEELVAMAPLVSPPNRHTLVLVTLALLEAIREGSTHLPWPPSPVFEERLKALGCSLAEVETSLKWVDGLKESQGVGLEPLLSRRGFTPLLFSTEGLHLHRLYHLERGLARLLLDRLRSVSSKQRQEAIAETQRLLETDFSPLGPSAPAVDLSDEQRRAVAHALASRLHCITGGPGTGKTSIVVWILAVLAHRLPKSESLERTVALVAPTGKAADRLQEATEEALLGIEGATIRSRSCLPKGQTLHRLLGISGRDGYPTFDSNNLLPHRVVIVDESSMVDLQLFRSLLDALDPSSRVIFLGDADQLPSVGPGAVFRDLVKLPGDHITTLTRSFRQDSEDPSGQAILHLARRINEASPRDPGVLKPPLVSTEKLEFEGYERLLAPTQGEFEHFLSTWRDRIACPPEVVSRLRRTFTGSSAGWHPGEESILDSLFRHFATHRLLVTTHGHLRDRGTQSINAWFQTKLVPGSNPNTLVPGQPVLMTRNHTSRGLRNGDLGLVLWARPVDGDPPRPTVVFSVQGRYLAFGLPEIRSALLAAWALTVHKAQGSEFERVALLLPSVRSRAISQEMLYTAVTRARRGVVIVGGDDRLAEATRTSSQRQTALQTRLREFAADNRAATQDVLQLGSQKNLFPT